MRDGGPADPDWRGFLAGYHAERPGITERVLREARDADGSTAYDWLALAVPPAGAVLDVACGSAPVFSPVLADRYLGVDVSAAELDLARARGARVVTGDAGALPVPDASQAVVLCSMALMVLPDLPAALAEMRRVLVPGGVLAAIMPTAAVEPRDLPFGVGLVAALGRIPRYPNDRALKDASGLLTAAGFRAVADERRRFALPLEDASAARLLTESLYLPGVPDDRVARLVAHLERAAGPGREAPIPIRRLVARAA